MNDSHSKMVTVIAVGLLLGMTYGQDASVRLLGKGREALRGLS